MKVVINVQFGGFGLSDFAIKEVYKRKEIELFTYKMSNEDYGNYDFIIDNFDKEIFPFHFSKFFGNRCNREDDIFDYFVSCSIADRTDKDLIDVVEKFGDKCNTRYSTLKIVEIPDDIDYEITDYDGFETIEEKHRSWQ